MRLRHLTKGNGVATVAFLVCLPVGEGALRMADGAVAPASRYAASLSMPAVVELD